MMDINSIATKNDLIELYDKIVKLILEKSNSFNGKLESKTNELLRSGPARRLLSVSENKLRDMRNKREIPFTVIGKTYYYSKGAIIELINDRMRKANP